MRAMRAMRVMRAFIRTGDVGKTSLVTWKNKFHFTDWNQVFTEATIVSNGDPLASSVAYVTGMLLMSTQQDSMFQELLQSISCSQIDSILKEDVKLLPIVS